MADTFGDLDTYEETAHVDTEVLKKKIAFDKVFLDCYNTTEGARMFKLLNERLVDVTIYEKGATLEATAYKQGMADVVKMMEACVEDALTPVQAAD